MKPLIDEVWAPISGYEGLYEVSDLGRVRSLDREHTMNGRHPTPYKRKLKGKLMKLSGSPYLMVTLNKLGCKPKRYLVHRLVAEQHCTNNGKPEVNHIDEDKCNNVATNLVWCSRKENASHSVKRFRGSNSGTAKLTERDVLSILDDLNNGYSQAEIAVNYNVTNHTIHKIKSGKNWGWLTGLG